nr:hypothetical protein [Roseomonas sp. SXEYE001]MCV4208090.1 hypothetical protein [Roseomonas sp. SXEYE001]
MNHPYWKKGIGAAALIAGLLGPQALAQAQQRPIFHVTPGPRIVTQEVPGLTDREAIRRWLCPNGGRPMRGRPGRCDGRGPAGGGASEVAGWHKDLPPPTRRQVACPAGTVPTEARANPGVVRCLPGEPSTPEALVAQAGSEAP